MWALQIQDFNFTPVYIRGDKNYADGLSRQEEINRINTQKNNTPRKR